MSTLWPHFTKEHPCPACGKSDWCCRAGERAFICMRVQSNRESPDGGWYHPYGNIIVKLPPPPPRTQTHINCVALLSAWRSVQSPMPLCAFAADLGVSEASLEALGAVWAPPHRAWAFPMRDGQGEIVGIRLRNMSGEKWAVKGSHAGIFVPQIPSAHVAYIAEGPTDTAAGVCMDLFTIGRPSCNCGGPEIAATLHRLKIWRAVMVSDGDDPGEQGSKRVADELHRAGIKTITWTPPAKDLRDFYRRGGNRLVVESQTKDFVWRR